MSDLVYIEEDGDVSGILCAIFGAKELRDLASNAGVSRERGDSKGDTAMRIVEQDPALAARILENDKHNPADCGPFRERREAGDGPIGLAEAMRRARHDKMHRKLESLSRSMLGLVHYKVEVDWEYGGAPGLTSISVKQNDDADFHPLLDARAHIILTPHGKCVRLEADGAKFISSRHEPEPRKQWKLGLKKIERFYDG